MKFEDASEQRELQFDQTFGKQKELYEFVNNENREFFEKCLQKCISLHPTMEVGDVTLVLLETLKLK